MLLTNIHNLPRGIFRAVVDSIQRPQPDILRVTELINPPIIKKLALENWDVIERDTSEFLWSILGSAVHAVLAKTDPDALIETRCTLSTKVQRITINNTLLKVDLSGQIDRYEKDEQSIDDYKCTSVWSYMFGLKPEWEAQLNVYKFLLESTLGSVVKRLKIHAILRDWQLSKAVQSDYPKTPFQTIIVPIWSKQQVLDYIESRYLIHQAEPKPCSKIERWQRDSTWAIMKEGRKSAVRVLDTEDEAIVYLSGNKIKEVDKKKCQIVERVGEAIRCKAYCLVRDICKYNSYKENA